MLELFVFIQIDMETHTKKPRGMIIGTMTVIKHQFRQK